MYQDDLPPSGSWSGWTRITPVSATVTGTPTIVQDTLGTIHLFVREYTNGALLEDTQNSGTSTWNADDSLGGACTSDPAAMATFGDYVFADIRGTNGDLYSTVNSSGTGDGWNAWESLAQGYTGTMEGSTSAVESANGVTLMNILARTASGGIEAINGDEDDRTGDQSHSYTWTSLGGSFAGS